MQVFRVDKPNHQDAYKSGSFTSRAAQLSGCCGILMQEVYRVSIDRFRRFFRGLEEKEVQKELRYVVFRGVCEGHRPLHFTR